jgi:hypothetical protein
MGNAYQSELWRDMFVVLGSSAAALIVLLFIATSLHINEIINNPILHRRAFNNTRYLLIILIETNKEDYHRAGGQIHSAITFSRWRGNSNQTIKLGHISGGDFSHHFAC